MRFATNIQTVERNAHNLHNFSRGSAEQKRFHRTRVRNALHHVVVSTSEGLIFAPAKWCGAADNDMDTYFANKDPVTDHFRRILRNIGYQQVSPGDPNHNSLYRSFVDYCAEHGFVHSKPGASERHYHIIKIDEGSLYPEELPHTGEFWEGAKSSVTVNRYERDSGARRACIAEKGASCSICEFNFGEVYGELGAGFIHVHHLVPLSSIDQAYKIDPSKDLVPVCPNCHAMLHRRSPPVTISEIKAIMRKAK